MRTKNSRTSHAVLIIAAAAVMTAALICAAFFVFPGLFDKQKEPERTDKSGGSSRLSAFIGGGEEIRGVYIATVGNINYPSQRGLDSAALLSELDGIVAACTDIGFNTIVFQVRPASDSFYKSALFPTSEFLCETQGGEVPGGVDILGELITRAHARNIAVIAWVNPLRVTSSTSAAYKQGDRSLLAASNPAVLHPEYCVDYAGLTYYNPALPAVRQLVADGCAEIASGYDVDGILFDDYFYPYPKNGASFDDSAAYAQYGGEAALDDWRRDNINSLVRESYEAVTRANPDCLFGIAPFGIWSNDNGDNGGSATRGLDAYSSIYCDALAWAKGGYIDFLAPQIYWSFDTAAAPYGVLCDWWRDALSDTGVTLLTSNAAYRVSEWSDSAELMRQLEYNREVGGYAGSLMYGYAAIASDENGVQSCLASAYSAAD